MDIATVIGLGLVVMAIIGAILAGGDITAFIDVPLFLLLDLVIGGTFINVSEVVENLVAVVMKAIFLHLQIQKKQLIN